MKGRILQISALLAGLLCQVNSYGHEGEEHGTHDAQHGGFVMMYDDIHFELAASALGIVEVYYTDAVRAQLPAATVSDVVVEVERSDGSIENLAMDISSDGGFWTGAGKPIMSADDIIRIGFVFQNNPLVLDVPFSAMAAPMGAQDSMSEMDHSNMPGMDHSSMPAMDHSGH